MNDIFGIIIGSAALTTIIGIIGRMLGWRFSPKEKIDVKKVASTIRLDDATIHSKLVEDDISVAKATMELLIQVRAELDKAKQSNEKLQLEKDTLRELAVAIQREYNKKDDEKDRKIQELMEQLDETERNLQEEKLKNEEMTKEIDRITLELKMIKLKYGIE